MNSQLSTSPDLLPRLQQEIIRLATALRSVAWSIDLTESRIMAQDTLAGYTFPDRNAAHPPAFPAEPLSFTASIHYRPNEGHVIVSQCGHHYLAREGYWTLGQRRIMFGEMTLGRTIDPPHYAHPTRESAAAALSAQQDRDQKRYEEFLDQMQVENESSSATRRT